MELFTFIITYLTCLLMGFTFAHLFRCAREYFEARRGNTYAGKLKKVYDLLTPKTWGQGRYFNAATHKICVQGAAIVVGNPHIAQCYKYGDYSTIYNCVYDESVIYKTNQSYGLASCYPKYILGREPEEKDLIRLWKSRPHWITVERYGKGNKELNYLLSMFGMDSWFNDDAKELAEVKTKIMQAINWAEKNEEFLTNN